MAVFEIPTRFDIYEYNFQVDLDGTKYELQMRYNQREDSWWLDLYDTDRNPIRTGVKIVSDWILFRTSGYRDIPPGAIIAVDTKQVPYRPTLEEIGQDVILTWIEP
jgi:hypothetical protein